ncbi:MAG: pentapeptide repeat-containing protein [Bacteroidota bacterium]
MCLFHSADLAWKKENRFQEEVVALIDYLEKNPISHESDCSGFVFIDGEYDNLFRGKTYRQRINFKNCIFHNKLYLIKSSVAGIDFSETTFKQKAVFQEVQFEGMFYAFAANFQNGLYAEDCQFLRHVYLDSSRFLNLSKKRGTSFNLKQCTFQESLSFTKSHFELSVSFTNVSFQGVEFDHAVLHKEFYIQDATINKTIQFDKTEFLHTEIISGYHSSVDFQNIDLKDTGKIIFQGKTPFYDQIRGEIYIGFKGKPSGTVLFENFNLDKFENSAKLQILELEKMGVVQIGDGCRKYKVRTPLKTIKIGQRNQDVALEFAQSFANYFIRFNGFNLRVEVVSKRRDSMDIFYFSDEDITQEELCQQLSSTEGKFWNYTYEDQQLPTRQDAELLREIDNYVSKLSVITKIGLRQKVALWMESETKSVLDAITFARPSIDTPAVNILIDKLYINPKEMKIGKLIAKKGSQVNIADRIDKIEFNQFQEPETAQEDVDAFKQLLSQLTIAEWEELTELVASAENNSNNPTGLQRLKSNVDAFFLRHGVGVGESLSATFIFETLRILMG